MPQNLADLDFEFDEIETSLRHFQDFKDTGIYRDLTNFWKMQLEMTKHDLLGAVDIEEVRVLQGMAKVLDQNLLLVDAHIEYLTENE
jgi:hypothetical protein